MIDSVLGASCVPASWAPAAAGTLLRVKHLVRGQVVANRLRLTALAALAMLNVFTLGAGRGGGRPAARPAGALAAPQGGGGAARHPRCGAGPARVAAARCPTSRGLAAALSPLLAQPTLGSHVGAIVTDLATGRVLFAHGATVPAAPASSAKLAHRGGGAERARPVRQVHHPGGGRPGPGVDRPGRRWGPDPGRGARRQLGDYPQPATLASLAARPRTGCAARGEHTVRLRYDDLAVHRPGHRAGLDGQLHQHRQRDPDHLPVRWTRGG